MPEIKNGRIFGIYASPRPGADKIPLAQAELIVDQGVREDYHAGRKPLRQVSLFARETLLELNAAGIDVDAGALRTNFLTEDFSLDALEPGTRLKIGKAIIEISEARKPCGVLTKINKRLPKATYLRCGQFGRVISGGQVVAGDLIEIL